MITCENDYYNELGIKDAEKRTERYKSGESMKKIKRFTNSKLFKDLDFPPDDDELDDGIAEF